MKNRIFGLITLFFLLTPFFASSQTVIDKIYEKYSGKEDFTSVNISSEMFGMFAGMNEMEGDAEEYREALSNLTGMKIISYEPKGEPDQKIIDEIKSMIPKSEFKQMMVVNSEDGGVEFLAKEKDGQIVEMLMVATDEGEITIMSFMGLIDLKTVAKLSQSMGMNKVGNVNVDAEVEEENE